MARKKTLYCSVCESQINEEDKFCKKCGTIFDDANDDEVSEIKSSDDYKIIKTYIQLKNFGITFKCISIVLSVILFICSLVSISISFLFFVYGFIFAITIFIMGFVGDLFFKWLSYMLKLNYKRTNK